MATSQDALGVSVEADSEINRLRAEVAALRGAVSELSRDRLALTGKLTVERVEGNKLRAKIERMRVNRDAALSMCRSSAEQLKRHNDAVAEVAAPRKECERMRDALGVQLNKYHAVYAAANALMARLGHDGTIDTNSPLVETLMDALDEVDGSTKGWL